MDTDATGLTPQQFDDWQTALRSARYKQGFGQLKKYSASPQEDSYCCMGVYCEAVAGFTIAMPFIGRNYGISGTESTEDDESTFPPAPPLAAIPQKIRQDLAALNDGDGLARSRNFVEIADWLNDHRAEIVCETP